MCALRGRQPGRLSVRAVLRRVAPYKGVPPLRRLRIYPSALCSGNSLLAQTIFAAKSENAYVKQMGSSHELGAQMMAISLETEDGIKYIDKILRDDSKARIAILFRGRNDNEAVYENILNDHGLDFFYGMFNDDDQNYIDFHIFCRDMFVSRFGSSKSISKRALSSFAEKIKRDYSSSDARATSSLFELLDARVFCEIQQECGSFTDYLWHWTDGKVVYETGRTSSELSDAISKDLKKRGMKFVGTTVIYAYLQAVGVIYSHDDGCFLANQEAGQTDVAAKPVSPDSL